MKTKHEGVQYECNQCDFHANKQEIVAGHIKTKHERKLYTNVISVNINHMGSENFYNTRSQSTEESDMLATNVTTKQLEKCS